MAILEREEYLAQLDQLLAEAAVGRGRLVLVRGEAGIGKSALVEAFTARRRGSVRWGICDPVLPPRPLAPILDIAAAAGGALRSAIHDDDRHRLFTEFLDALRAPDGRPSITVIEDLQWADEATLQLVRMVGRRIGQLPALVLATVRDEDVGRDHALSLALGDIPATAMVTLRLPPLTVDAVGQLAAGADVDPESLHAATAGNPFFVTEVLAGGGAELPATVREAVWARARRLPPAALRVVKVTSVFGPRRDASLICSVADADAADLDECVARGLLRLDGNTVEFRHLLAHQSVLESMSARERIALHRGALAALRASASEDVAEMAHQAVAAGDPEAVLELAPRAAKRAAAVGAHRAAREYYERALAHAARLRDAECATLYLDHARECFVTEDVRRAIASAEHAVGRARAAGEVVVLGRALTDLAQYLFWQGYGERAHAAVGEAVEVLEAVTPGPELAQAYARWAGISLVSTNDATAVAWGHKALALAETLGQEDVVIHALNTIGTAEIGQGVADGWAKLDESLRRARAAGREDLVWRAYVNMTDRARETRRYDVFDRVHGEAVAFFADRDLDAAANALRGDLAEADLERGRWDAAGATARLVVDDPVRCASGRLQGLVVLARLAVRRGDGNSATLLDDALALLNPTTDGSVGICHVRAARAEAAWLRNDLTAAGDEVSAGLAAVQDKVGPWQAGELAYWASKLDASWPAAVAIAEPYALQFQGDIAGAAAAWAALDCPYNEARTRADSDDEAQLRRALELFHALGATPWITLVTTRLRALGATGIARGPRAATRANPVGLSNREVEVLALVAQGLRNGEIARQLVLSPKTIERHVAAVYAKLGVHSRADAGERAAALGIATS